MRGVIAELTGKTGVDMEYDADFWHKRLVQQSHGVPYAPLKPSEIGQAYGARAFQSARAAPAWDRIQELEGRIALSRPVAPEREREQKFRILGSHGQAIADFSGWTGGGKSSEVIVGVLFIDIDDFKSLNSRFTEVRIDERLLKPFQILLDRLTLHRGWAYKIGGDEFVIMLPNHTPQEIETFANRVREAAARQVFDMGGAQAGITVSIGVARFPQHGADYDTVTEAAARAKQKGAKAQGKNRVAIAP